MGVIYVTDPNSGLPVGVQIDGMTPTATEQQRIDEMFAPPPMPVEPEPEETSGGFFDTINDISRGGRRAVLQTFADLPSGIVGAGELALGYNRGETGIGQAARGLTDRATAGIQSLYGDPEDSFGEKAGQAVGSIAALGGAGGLASLAARGAGAGARAAGLTGGATASVMGGGLGAQEQFRRIEDFLAQGGEMTDEQARAAGLTGAAIGLSEGFPIGSFLTRAYRLLQKVPPQARGEAISTITGRLKRMARAGAEEGAQEVIAGVAQDLTEKGIYNPEAEVGGGAFDAALYGGGAGAAFQGILDTIAGRRVRGLDQLDADLEREDAEAAEAARNYAESIREPDALQIPYLPPEEGGPDIPISAGEREAEARFRRREQEALPRIAAMGGIEGVPGDPEYGLPSILRMPGPPKALPAPDRSEPAFYINPAYDFLGSVEQRAEAARAAQQPRVAPAGQQAEVPPIGLTQQDVQFPIPLPGPRGTTALTRQQPKKKKPKAQQIAEDVDQDAAVEAEVAAEVLQPKPKKEKATPEKSPEEIQTDASRETSRGMLTSVAAPRSMAATEKSAFRRAVNKLQQQKGGRVEGMNITEEDISSAKLTQLERDQLLKRLAPVPEATEKVAPKIDSVKRRKEPDGATITTITGNDGRTWEVMRMDSGSTMGVPGWHRIDMGQEGPYPGVPPQTYVGDRLEDVKAAFLMDAEPDVTPVRKPVRELKREAELTKAEREEAAAAETTTKKPARKVADKRTPKAKVDPMEDNPAGTPRDVNARAEELISRAKAANQIGTAAEITDQWVRGELDQKRLDRFEKLLPVPAKTQKTKKQAQKKRMQNAAKAEPRAQSMAYNAQIDRIYERLRERLTSYGMPEGFVTLVTGPILNQNAGIQGTMYSTENKVPGEVNALIALSTDTYSPDLTEAQLEARLAQVLDHEALHAAKELGFFSPQEWNALAKAAAKRKRVLQDGTERDYSYLEFEFARNQRADPEYRLDDESVIEEAIAEMFRGHVLNKQKMAGRPLSLWKRLVNLMKAMASPLREYNFKRADDIFENLSTGKQVSRDYEEYRIKDFRPGDQSQSMFKGWSDTEVIDMIKEGEPIDDINVDDDAGGMAGEFFANPEEFLAQRGMTLEDINDMSDEEFMRVLSSEPSVMVPSKNSVEKVRKRMLGLVGSPRFEAWANQDDGRKLLLGPDGKPLILYRGIEFAVGDPETRGNYEWRNVGAYDTQFIRPRWMTLKSASDWHGAIFASVNPYVASGYTSGAVDAKTYGPVIPFVARVSDLKQFNRTWDTGEETLNYFKQPTQVQDFDISELNEWARDVRPNEAMIVPDTRDPGPTDLDEEMSIRERVPSDVYIFPENSDIKSVWSKDFGPRRDRPQYRRRQLFAQPTRTKDSIPVEAVARQDFEVVYTQTWQSLSKYLGKIFNPPAAEKWSGEFMTKFQDSMLYVGKLVDDLRAQGAELTDLMDPYRQEEIMHGRQGDLIRRAEEQLYDPTVAALAKINPNNMGLDRLRNVSGYFKFREQQAAEPTPLTEKLGNLIKGNKNGQLLMAADAYLYALHADERNAEIAKRTDGRKQQGSGMSSQEAADIIAWKRSLPAEVQAQLDTFVQGMGMIRDDINTKRVKYGLIPEDYTEAVVMENGDVVRTNREHYKNYIPLRGKIGEDGDLEYTIGSRTDMGLGIVGKEDKGAVGRSDYAPLSPTQMMMSMHGNTLMRGERNRVTRSLVDMARELRENSPELLEGERWIEEVTPPTKEQTYVTPDGDTKVIKRVDPTWLQDESVIPFKEDGQQKYLRVADPKVGRAMRRTANPSNMNGFIRMVSSFNRYLANINTSYNPEFLFSNAFRDIETALVNASQYEVEQVRQRMMKDVARSSGTLRDFFRKGQRTDEAPDYSSPLAEASAEQRIARIQEFMASGGKQMANQMGDIANIDEGIRRTLTQISDADSLGEQGAKAVRDGFNKLTDFLEDYNMVVENAGRFAFYNSLRESGVSADKAAQSARNLTTNFSKKGEWGQAMNGLYLFYNASLQGSMAMINAATRSRKAQMMLAGAVATGAILDQLNAAFSEEDEDGIKKWDKIPEYELQHNLIIGNAKIPMAYGINMFFNTGRAVSRALRGGYDASDLASTITDTVLETFNPLGDSQSLFSWAMPTVGDPTLSVIMNENFAGAPIYKEPFDENLVPPSERYWSSVSPTLKGATDFLNDITGGTDTLKGLISINPEVAEFYMDYFTGATGRTIMRTLEAPFTIVMPTISGDFEREFIRETPILRRLAVFPATREDRALFTEKFNKVNLARTELRNAIDARDRGRIEKARSRFSEELRLYPRANAIENQLSKLRQQREAVRENQRLSDQRRKELLDRLDAREQALIARGNKILKDL